VYVNWKYIMYAIENYFAISYYEMHIFLSYMSPCGTNTTLNSARLRVSYIISLLQSSFPVSRPNASILQQMPQAQPLR